MTLIFACSVSCQPVANRSGGFYVHPAHNHFKKLAKIVNTDKIDPHNYETLYGKYFELMYERRHTVRKIFEIGLGCNMQYGPGHSARLWRQYFPSAEVWMAEYDKECVERHKQTLVDIGVHVVTGDQASLLTLRSWINETGGGFDVVIDDGGHSSMQQYNSLILLFLHALRPGGIYILEDLQIARTQQFVDGDKQHIMIDVIKDMLEALVIDPGDGYADLSAYTPRW
eukprot:CAMPEP_0202862440 /NCGR_PEP_ID=MMETSP1391-20130828/3477_1 /ASSEMBLY_ACC=CAM_ASM_000867 /TAXON_ID=1034604 /ORGANISM="Chlamydomonas leiostraca, Strain SAG 11-49" /LENGTH=226 /DNA_ID=CAMNT_0049541979 /DNA_START=434 /DNA_END=1111 /DNA_ORIENTATION=+